MRHGRGSEMTCNVCARFFYSNESFFVELRANNSSVRRHFLYFALFLCVPVNTAILMPNHAIRMHKLELDKMRKQLKQFHDGARMQ